MSAGIIPFNPDKVLQSTHVKRHTRGPTTPTKPRNNKHELDLESPDTPKRFHDFELSRDFKAKKHLNFLRKAGKAFEQVQLDNIQKDYQIEKLQLQLSAYTNRTKRKKVQIAPKEVFANIESIKATKDKYTKAAEKEATRAARYTKTHIEQEFEKASKAAEAAEEAGMTFVFKLAA